MTQLIAVLYGHESVGVSSAPGIGEGLTGVSRVVVVDPDQVLTARPWVYLVEAGCGNAYMRLSPQHRGPTTRHGIGTRSSAL